MAQSTKKTKKKAPVSPFSTGGGGVLFEHNVAAYFLTIMLTGVSPRGFSDFEISGVKFQRSEIDGLPMDDLIITLDLPHATNHKAILGLQLKHDMQWGDGDSNATYKAVMRACWKTFKSQELGEYDLFGVALGKENANLQSYRNVILTANKCKSGDDFAQVVQKSGNQKEKSFLTLITNTINTFLAEEIPSRTISNDETWNFIKRLKILSFDVLSEDSRDRENCDSYLKSSFKLKRTNDVRNLWNELLRVAAEANMRAGSFDRESLSKQISRHLPKTSLTEPSQNNPTINEETPLTMQALVSLLNSTSSNSLTNIKNSVLFDDSSTKERVIAEAKFEGQIDSARELLKTKQPSAARLLLQKVKEFKDFPLSPHLQFRLYANLGNCASMLGDESLSIIYYRNAYNQEKDNPKAMVIGAQAELLDGNIELALEISSLALKAEPRLADAALIYIQALYKAENKDVVDAWLNNESWVLNEPNCNIAIAKIERENGNINGAIHRLEQLQKQGDTSTEVTFELAFLYLSRPYDTWRKNSRLSWNLPAYFRLDLLKCIKHYNAVIKANKDAEYKEQKIHSLTNQAVAHMLLNQNTEAKTCLQQAISDAPDSPTPWLNMGWIHIRERNFEKAVEAHEKAYELLKANHEDDVDWTEDNNWWENFRGLAFSYFQTNQWTKLQQHLEKVVRWNGTEIVNNNIVITEETLDYDLANFISMWLMGISGLVSENVLDGEEKARLLEVQKSALDWIEINLPKQPHALAIRSDLAWSMKSYAVAIKLLRSAIRNSPLESRESYQLVLAESLFTLGCYRVAAPIYKKVVKENFGNTPLRHYVISLNRIGQISEANRISILVRSMNRKAGESEGKAIPVFSEIEANYAEYIGDVNRAMSLRRQLLQQDPTRTDFSTAMAMMSFHSGDLSNAQNILQNSPTPDAVKHPELALNFAHAKAAFNLPGALELGYNAWRASAHRTDLQVSYISLFQKLTVEENPLISPKTVGIDCAVTLQRLSDDNTEISQPWTKVIISPSLTSPPLPNEILADDSQYMAMFGKNVGEIVVFQNGDFGEIKARIKNIRHKYVYAFQETIERFGRGELQHPAWMVGNIEAEGGIEKWLKQQEILLKQHRESWEIVADLYQKQTLPLSSIAMCKNRFVLEFWNEINNVGGRFYASEINVPRLIEEIKFTHYKNSLILDQTALGCIILLGIEAIVTRKFTNLLVPFAVREEIIRQRLEEIQFGSSAGYLTHDGRGLRYYESEPDAQRKRIKFLTSILAFIDKYCQVETVPTLLTVGQEWVQALGKGTTSAILLSQEKNLPLWSDDLRIRMIGMAVFKITATHSTPVLYCLSEKMISGDKLQESLCKLSLHGYTYIWLPAEALIKRLEQDDLKLSGDTRNILFRAFNGHDIYIEWAAQSLARFLHQLWLKRPLELKFREILYHVLDSYIFERSTATAIDKLKIELKTHFRLDPYSLKLIFSDIRRWESINLRVINRGSLLENGKIQVASLEDVLEFAALP